MARFFYLHRFFHPEIDEDDPVLKTLAVTNLDEIISNLTFWPEQLRAAYGIQA